MNENRFFLRTKIIIKMKKFTKNFHGGQFSGRVGGNFPGVIFQGAFFLEPFFGLNLIEQLRTLVTENFTQKTINIRNF